MQNLSLVAQEATCTLNGEVVDCSELETVAAIGLGIFAVVGLIMLVSFVFWVVALIHVLSNDVENKGLWLAIIILVGGLGGVIYYFAVQRPFNKALSLIHI